MVQHGLIVQYENMRLIMKKKKKSALNNLAQLIDVDKEKCVNCHACISACPVKYCNDGSGEIVSVDSDMCIACGECLVACTHGARRYKDDTNAMFDALDAGEKIVAIVAPAVAANFPGQYMNINGWLKVWAWRRFSMLVSGLNFALNLIWSCCGKVIRKR